MVNRGARSMHQSCIIPPLMAFIFMDKKTHTTLLLHTVTHTCTHAVGECPAETEIQRDLVKVWLSPQPQWSVDTTAGHQ